MKLQAQLVYMVDENSLKDKHLLQNGHFDYILKVLHIPNKWICVTIDRSVFKESSYVIGEIYTLNMNHFKKSISMESTGRIEPIVQNTENFLWDELGNKGQRDIAEIPSTKPQKLNQWMAFTYASYRKTT
jgi:hypothetical protein